MLLTTTLGRTIAASLVIAVGLGGCGRETGASGSAVADPASSDPASSDPAPSDPAPNDPASGDPVDEDAAADEDVTVTAADYAYHDLPGTIAAGTRIALHNVSTVELHELIAFRLPDDEQRTVDELLTLPENEADAVFAGEPATVILAPPDADGFAVVGDGTLTEPGRYVLLCAIPTGADPQAYLDSPPGDGPPEVDGGPPHFTRGMYAEVQVE